MKFNSVHSSTIAAVGYDKRFQTLGVEFKDKKGPNRRYLYLGVPEDVYNGMMSAESKGRFFHSRIVASYGWFNCTEYVPHVEMDAALLAADVLRVRSGSPKTYSQIIDGFLGDSWPVDMIVHRSDWIKVQAIEYRRGVRDAVKGIVTQADPLEIVVSEHWESLTDEALGLDYDKSLDNSAVAG